MDSAKLQIGKVGSALGLASVGLTLYWTFTYSGPYRYLAELQLKWFGVYYRELTAIVVILGFLGIAMAIKLVFRGAERTVPGAPTRIATARPGTTSRRKRGVGHRAIAFLLVR